MTSAIPIRKQYEVLIPQTGHGLEKEYIALCHQIRTIDKKRLSKHYGHLSE
jgi:mRNA-degrading endonuclease toxin of MazEF toxin-antitoxin module